MGGVSASDTVYQLTLDSIFITTKTTPETATTITTTTIEANRNRIIQMRGPEFRLLPTNIVLQIVPFTVTMICEII